MYGHKAYRRVDIAQAVELGNPRVRHPRIRSRGASGIKITRVPGEKS